MQKTLIMSRLFFVICIQLCFILSVEANTTKESLNKIIRSYRNCDLNCLELNISEFKHKYSNNDSQILEVIYHVLLAEKYSRELDNKNNKSEILYRKAITLAKNIHREDLIIWAETHFGFYYYKYSAPIKALPYFLETFQKIEAQSKRDLLEAEIVLKKNAYYFGFIEDYKQEELYLKEALQFCIPNSENHTELLNNLGMSYLKQNQLGKAEQYFIQTRDLALKNKQEVRYAKALGELAKIYILQNDFAIAKTLFMEDIAISKKNNSDRNTMYAQIELGKLYLLQKNFNNASIVLNEAKNYVRTKVHLASFEYEITELLLAIAIQKKDSINELEYRRVLDSLKKVIALSDGQTVVDRLNLQVQKERIKSQLEIEKTKLERASLLQWAWITVSLLLFIILILIYIIYQRKFKLQGIAFDKDVLSFQLEQIKSEKKLNETRATLSSYQIYLSEKNDQLTKLEKEFKKLKTLPKLASKAKGKTLEELLESHLMTKENWLRFKTVFIKEQPDYYNYLMENFPDLTEANLRIVLLQKIGLKNIETAQLLGVTLEAVKKAKQRLKKRYEPNYSDIFNEV